jgi:gamma-glutamyltranspeptidase / glutathione hydrolase
VPGVTATPSTRRAAVRSGPPGSAGVAGGSAEVAAAAASTLVAGGSAVDAALAGAFAAVMSEPALTSLGGGGFCLHSEPDAAPEVLDFFVDVPGIGATGGVGRLETVVVDFARTGAAAESSLQVFHGGWGSVAVPGCLSGYLALHRRAGRVPLSAVVAPALALARNGVRLSAGQRTFQHLVSELLRITPDSAALFGPVEETGRYVNHAYGDLLEEIAGGRVTALSDAEFADALLAGSRAGGGLLTRADLEAYEPRARVPIALRRGPAHVWTNPPPSVGGSIVVDALGALPSRAPGSGVRWSDVAEALVDATARRRGPGQVPTGTTHVSVVDARGGVAALTTSNGSGSGALVPGWGVALNNMLGEEDLRPADGSALPPGARMGSMMSPTVVDLSDGRRVVLGTGGSERIRSAVLGVLVRLVEEGLDLAAAVDAPRVHAVVGGPIHLEPGLPDDDLVALAALSGRRDWDGLNPWPAPNLFFGGVHAVQRSADGSVEAVGDARRTGAVAIVLPDGSVSTA